jgi:hypothetical protein
MILPALRRGQFQVSVQENIGRRLSGGKHYVDVVASKADRRLLISLKWQQVSGTAEQKVPFEVICLLEAINRGGYAKAYLVLGGEGWTLREFYTSGGLQPYLRHGQEVEILTLESFVGRANAGSL